MVRFGGVLYGKSFSVIDCDVFGEPIGKIDKLIGGDYVPRLDGETNTAEILDALVYEQTENGMILQCNEEYCLFEKIEE